jgi:hypothetical protein
VGVFGPGRNSASYFGDWKRRPRTLRRQVSTRVEDAGVSGGTRCRPTLEASLNDSEGKAMSGFDVERRQQPGAQDAVEATEAQ